MMAVAQSDPIWSAADAATATGGINTADWQASGISIDSRSVDAGDLFVALPGPNFDGHKFVEKALEKGASAAMIKSSAVGMPTSIPQLTVDDTYKALRDLGDFSRNRNAGKIIAVTGSVGKTSVKESIAHLLGKQDKTVATTGNLNNDIGVPLSLARLPADTRYGVFELGMNHAGELRALSQLVRPHVAVITNVEAVHLEFFESVEAIADAKSEIFEGLEPGGVAILNRDNPHFDRLAKAAARAGVERVISFGQDSAADVRVIDSKPMREGGTEVKISMEASALSYRLAMPGHHRVLNSLAALAAIRAAGGDAAEAASEMGKLVPVYGRGNHLLITTPALNLDVIDDSYNASPASVRAALDVLGQSRPERGGRRIAILGDMLELGTSSPDLHAGLAPAVAAAGVDHLFAVGPMMRHLFDAVSDERRGGWSQSASQLASIVGNAVHDGDVVLVKGSAGVEMGQIVDALRSLGTDPTQTVNDAEGRRRV